MTPRRKLLFLSLLLGSVVLYVLVISGIIFIKRQQALHTKQPVFVRQEGPVFSSSIEIRGSVSELFSLQQDVSSLRVPTGIPSPTGIPQQRQPSENPSPDTTRECFFMGCLPPPVTTPFVHESVDLVLTGEQITDVMRMYFANSPYVNDLTVTIENDQITMDGYASYGFYRGPITIIAVVEKGTFRITAVDIEADFAMDDSLIYFMNDNAHFVLGYALRYHDSTLTSLEIVDGNRLRVQGTVPEGMVAMEDDRIILDSSVMVQVLSYTLEAYQEPLRQAE